MGTPFLSEIRICSFNFAPKGWALCNGQFLPINQNQALFSLLGTTYGGNGQTTFALPDLRGRVPLHFGTHALGELGGQEVHTLIQSELPAHTHTLSAAAASATPTSVPTGNLLAQERAGLYKPPQQTTALHPSAVTNVGGSQAHENRQPYLVLNFCIALQGIFPSQN